MTLHLPALRTNLSEGSTRLARPARLPESWVSSSTCVSGCPGLLALLARPAVKTLLPGHFFLLLFFFTFSFCCSLAHISGITFVPCIPFSLTVRKLLSQRRRFCCSWPLRVLILKVRKHCVEDQEWWKYLRRNSKRKFENTWLWLNIIWPNTEIKSVS